MVGVIDDLNQICGQSWQSPGDQIYLLDDGRFFCKKDYDLHVTKIEEMKINEGLFYIDAIYLFVYNSLPNYYLLRIYL